MKPRRAKYLIDSVRPDHITALIIAASREPIPKSAVHDVFLQNGLGTPKRPDVEHRLCDLGVFKLSSSQTYELTDLGGLSSRVIARDPTMTSAVAHCLHYICPSSQGTEYLDTYRMVTDLVYDDPGMKSRDLSQRIIATIRAATENPDFGFDSTTVTKGLYFINGLTNRTKKPLSAVGNALAVFLLRAYQHYRDTTQSTILLTPETYQAMARAMYCEQVIVPKLITDAVASMPGARMLSTVSGLVVVLK